MLKDEKLTRKDVMFYEYPQVLMVSKTCVQILAKPIALGMGVDWRTHRKSNPVLLEKGGVHYTPHPISGQQYQARTVNKLFLPEYFDSICTSRVKKDVRSRVELFKSEFIDFIESQTIEQTENRAEFYEESLEGIEVMVNELLCVNKNKGAVKLVSQMIWGIIRCDRLTENDSLNLTHPVYDLQDIAARNPKREELAEMIASELSEPEEMQPMFRDTAA